MKAQRQSRSRGQSCEPMSSGPACNCPTNQLRWTPSRFSPASWCGVFPQTAVTEGRPAEDRGETRGQALASRARGVDEAAGPLRPDVQQKPGAERQLRRIAWHISGQQTGAGKVTPPVTQLPGSSGKQFREFTARRIHLFRQKSLQWCDKLTIP